MFWRVEVKNKPTIIDPVGEGIKRDILDLGINTVSDVKMVQVYIIEAELPFRKIKKICVELLCDEIMQEYKFGLLEDKSFRIKQKKDFHIVEIAYNPGVMDPWEESTKKGIRDLGIKGISSVKTGRLYLIQGGLTEKQLSFTCEKLLYNKLIQHIVKIEYLKKTLQAHKEVGYQFKKITLDLARLSDKELLALSRKRQLYLNREEMLTIKNYFFSLGRSSTDCELETIAQTWSEHCWHKTLRGIVEYTDNSMPGKRKKTVLIHNTLKSTIMKATKKLNKPWCVSVFKDNAGIINFDENYNICFKVETHNHPSALEPYGGAGTGIGGVIRDILGVGLGAKPIMNTDVFCFGPPEINAQQVPKGALHPKRIMKGVVAGVRDYGNRMGIPTANGAVLFDERYTANPLVYCGTVGIMPRKYSCKRVNPGEVIVLLGGHTGRDGIHGATFSSGELTHESEVISSGAVQIGNAITEKKVLDTLLQARDENLYTAVTDLGAGGLSSAVGEMGSGTGARVDLEKVPLKYKGLSYTEIWISEAQERMLIAVPKDKLKRLIRIFKNEDVEATVIGEFTKTKRLELFYDGECVCNLDMDFLHNGLPEVVRKALWSPPKIKESKNKKTKDLSGVLLKVISDLNVCSKEWIIRQYDHEVQGMSVLKPLGGATNDGPQDAAVLKPLSYSKKGIAVSCGINPRFSEIDPYWMAISCIDEALRQVIAVGGSLKQVALLDNFSWGNTSKAECLGQLIRACFGCYDAALGYGVPFISGKDSLNNEYTVGKKSISIPPTLLISAIAIIDDVEKVVSADAKKAGNLIYCVGTTFDEMGGSCYDAVNRWQGSNVPKVNFKKSGLIFEHLSQAIQKGVVASCHDCSEGGLAVALAEMAFSGNLGMEIFLAKLKHKIKRQRLKDDILLFSESNSRFIVEVEEQSRDSFEKILKSVDFSLIGRLIPAKDFKILGTNGQVVINTKVNILKEAWQRPLRW